MEDCKCEYPCCGAAVQKVNSELCHQYNRQTVARDTSTDRHGYTTFNTCCSCERPGQGRRHTRNMLTRPLGCPPAAMSAAAPHHTTRCVGCWCVTYDVCAQKEALCLKLGVQATSLLSESLTSCCAALRAIIPSFISCFEGLPLKNGSHSSPPWEAAAEEHSTVHMRHTGALQTYNKRHASSCGYSQTHGEAQTASQSRCHMHHHKEHSDRAPRQQQLADQLTRHSNGCRSKVPTFLDCL